MTDEQTMTAETKRDRVRRLLIAPLTEWGFRKPGDVREEKHAKFLTNLADSMAYMTDVQLEQLRDFLKTRGEGKDRRGWPRMATIVPFAEQVAPRPLEEHPTICSWFGSARGRQALAEGTLVSEFLFLTKFKRPPLTDGDWMRVRGRAQELDSERRVKADRRRRGVASQDDLEFLAWMDGIEARAMALLPEQGRGAA